MVLMMERSGNVDGGLLPSQKSCTVTPVPPAPGCFTATAREKFSARHFFQVRIRTRRMKRELCDDPPVRFFFAREDGAGL